ALFLRTAGRSGKRGSGLGRRVARDGPPPIDEGTAVAKPGGLAIGWDAIGANLLVFAIGAAPGQLDDRGAARGRTVGLEADDVPVVVEDEDAAGGAVVRACGDLDAALIELAPGEPRHVEDGVGMNRQLAEGAQQLARGGGFAPYARNRDRAGE